MRAARIAAILLRQYARSPLLVSLFIVVPALFLTLAYYTTKPVEVQVLVTRGGQRLAVGVSQPDLHGATMVPIVAAFLAGIVGLFVMLEARRSDGRLVVAGVPAAMVGSVRLMTIVVLGTLVALVSVAVTLLNFRPGDYIGFTAATVLVAVTYGFVGALVSLLVGRLGGAYLMLFLPMIDVGIFQDPMFVSGEQSWWMKALPGFGGTRLLLDAGFTHTADDWAALAAAVAWAFGLAAIALVVFTRRSPG